MHYLAQPDFAVFFYKDDFWGGTGWVKARLSTPRIGACCPTRDLGPPMNAEISILVLSAFIGVHRRSSAANLFLPS
jgi:hypothetical protein